MKEHEKDVMCNTQGRNEKCWAAQKGGKWENLLQVPLSRGPRPTAFLYLTSVL
jgi:hypothetical protein